MKSFKIDKKIKPGVVYLPYIMKTKSTSINGVTVWHSNKFINLMLKIKHFFFKPKEIELKYNKRTIDTNFYVTININNDER
jgi:hypothetical protein